MSCFLRVLSRAIIVYSYIVLLNEEKEDSLDTLDGLESLDVYSNAKISSLTASCQQTYDCYTTTISNDQIECYGYCSCHRKNHRHLTMITTIR